MDVTGFDFSNSLLAMHGRCVAASACQKCHKCFGCKKLVDAVIAPDEVRLMWLHSQRTLISPLQSCEKRMRVQCVTSFIHLALSVYMWFLFLL
jgi:hypothetical protein